jgi:hypothetical protein
MCDVILTIIIFLPLLGKCLGPIEAKNHHLVSGNRVLHSARRDAQDFFVLG